MIDTGAEFSLIKPGVCNPKWKTKISAEIKAFGKIFKSNYIYKFPLFKEFGSFNPSKDCEFLELDFHDRFHGIIGNNILDEINCKIDYSNRELVTPNAKVPFFFGKKKKNIMNKCKEKEILKY